MDPQVLVKSSKFMPATVAAVLIAAAAVGALLITGYRDNRSKPLSAANADYKIRITAPFPHAVVKSPFSVEGDARGMWYSEGQFPVRLLDANGNIIASAPAHAQGNWMTENPVPFEATLAFKAPNTSSGMLVLEKDNPSGIPENADSVSIPVRFR